MKKLLSLFTFVFICATSFAQNSEGHISYVVDISSDNPEMEMSIGMMKGMKMDVYFKDEMSRSVVDMGMLMTMTNITDNGSGEVLMLMSGMIGEKAIKTTSLELNSDDEEDELEDLKVELFDETKMIEGFKCKKAILTNEEGVVMTYWYTKKINVHVDGNQFMNDKIPGFPMEISMETPDMKMVFTVDKYEKKVDNDEMFDMSIPDGYELMTIEDFKGMGM